MNNYIQHHKNVIQHLPWVDLVDLPENSDFGKSAGRLGNPLMRVVRDGITQFVRLKDESPKVDFIVAHDALKMRANDAIESKLRLNR